jgi:peptide/nickel transport system substrate-binding protein
VAELAMGGSRTSIGMRRARLVTGLFASLILAACGSSTPTVAPSGPAATGGAETSGPETSQAANPSATTGTSAQCQPGGTLVMARNQEPDTFNPLTGVSGNGTIFEAMQIYQRLIEQSSESRDPVPGLASSWEAAPDGLSYTFHLTEAKFSNGDPVTAEDVKFSLLRFADPNVDATAAFLAVNIKDVVIVDPSTIRLEMKQVDASILAALTLMEASILPEKVVTALGDEKFGEQPVGSGPFMVKAWTPGQSVELVRNPNYDVDGKPYLDGITFLFIKDDNARILKAQSNEAQVIEAVPMPDAGTIKSLDGWHLDNDAILAQDNVWLNHSWQDSNGTKLLADKLIRQALNYATPKDTVNQVVFNGLATISNTGTTITQYWDPSITPYPYDVDKAKAALAQSSAPNGFTLPLSIPANDTVSQQTAELIQQAWAQIGVTVDIQPQDPAVQADDITALKYAAALRHATSITSDTPDDSELASIMYDWSTDWKSFFTDYKSADASKLVHDAVATTDPAQRQKLYSQLQQLTLDDAVTVPIVIPPALTAVSNQVQGFKTIPAGWWLMQDVCLAQ